MKNLAIIPARGGSKRIKLKNIKDFHGKPIIYYSIQAAIDSNLFDTIVVSTDDHKIANIAKSLGASVPFMRSDENSDDHASTSSVIIEVLSKAEIQSQSFINVCCLYPASPFNNAHILRDSLQKMSGGKFDSIISAIKFTHPIQRAFKLSNESRIEMVQPAYTNTRSQDLEPTFHDAGQFYWLNVEAFLNSKTIWMPNSGLYELNPNQAHDIDTMEDWEIAEFKFSVMTNKLKHN